MTPPPESTTTPDRDDVVPPCAKASLNADEAAADRRAHATPCHVITLSSSKQARPESRRRRTTLSQVRRVPVRWPSQWVNVSHSRVRTVCAVVASLCTLFARAPQTAPQTAGPAPAPTGNPVVIEFFAGAPDGAPVANLNTQTWRWKPSGRVRTVRTLPVDSGDRSRRARCEGRASVAAALRHERPCHRRPHDRARARRRLLQAQPRNNRCARP